MRTRKTGREDIPALKALWQEAFGDERELALQFGVNSIPTVMVFQNGEIKATSVGYRPKEEIEQLLK